MNQKTARTKSRPRPKIRRDKKHLRRIVILDDEPDVKRAYEIVLPHILGHPSRLKIVTFTDGDKAARKLSRSNPDLFITDQRHPGMKCDEIFEILARRKANYPVFVISAGASASRKRELLKLSRTHGLTIKVLPKPFSIDDLRRVLARYFHLCK